MDTSLVTLSSTPEFDAVEASASKRFLVDLTLTAPPSSADRAAVNLVAIVDTSGSMSGQKLNLVQDSLEFLIGQLQDQDSFALVEFNSGAKVDFSLSKMTAPKKKQALEATDRLLATGSTNMLMGLSVGLGLLRNRIMPPLAGVSSFLLFTDGLPDKTHGIQDHIRDSFPLLPDGCTLHTFGYGADHNGTFLTGLSQEGKGSYYFLQKPDDIPNSFADVLGGLLSVVAQNLVLEIFPCEGVKLMEIQTTFVKETETRVKIPDLYGDEKRDVLVQVEVSPFALPEVTHQPLFTSTLSYFNVLSSALVKSPTHMAMIKRPRIVDPEQSKTNIHVSHQQNRVLAAQSLSNAKQLADTGDLETAREVLTTCLQQLTLSASVNEPGTQMLVTDLRESIQNMKQKSAYQAHGEKQLSVSMQEHTLQRSLRDSSFMYSTSSKILMRSTLDESRESLNDDRYERRLRASSAGFMPPMLPSRQTPNNTLKQATSGSSPQSTPKQQTQVSVAPTAHLKQETRVAASPVAPLEQRMMGYPTPPGFHHSFSPMLPKWELHPLAGAHVPFPQELHDYDQALHDPMSVDQPTAARARPPSTSGMRGPSSSLVVTYPRATKPSAATGRPS